MDEVLMSFSLMALMFQMQSFFCFSWAQDERRGHGSHDLHDSEQDNESSD